MVSKINFSSFRVLEFVSLEMDNLHSIISSYFIVLCTASFRVLFINGTHIIYQDSTRYLHRYTFKYFHIRFIFMIAAKSARNAILSLIINLNYKSLYKDSCCCVSFNKFISLFVFNEWILFLFIESFSLFYWSITLWKCMQAFCLKSS